MNNENRRELKVRDIKLTNKFAKYLSGKNITPNQISIISIVFAAFAALTLLAIPIYSFNWITFVLTAVFIQCRLLCNLFDGMVAVEGGKSTPSGELFNDIPDRIADPLILISAGYAVNFVAFGWLAGLMAVMTAYIRTLSSSIGAPINFKGPMAKQHRMACLTLCCLLSPFESIFWSQGSLMRATLIIIILGCFLTVINRTYEAYKFLERKND